ncbi:MAG: hypothetical protein AAF549_04985 [Pseudomonadota bacterium]
MNMPASTQIDRKDDKVLATERLRATVIAHFQNAMSPEPPVAFSLHFDTPTLSTPDNVSFEIEEDPSKFQISLKDSGETFGVIVKGPGLSGNLATLASLGHFDSYARIDVKPTDDDNGTVKSFSLGIIRSSSGTSYWSKGANKALAHIGYRR